MEKITMAKLFSYIIVIILSIMLLFILNVRWDQSPTSIIVPPFEPSMQVMTIEGRVSSVYSTNDAHYLVMAPVLSNDLYVVIDKADLQNFSVAPNQYYNHRLVRVTGNIRKLHDRVEIIARKSDQIIVIE